MNKSGEQDIQVSRCSDPRNTRRKGVHRSTCAAGRRVCEDAGREKGRGYPHAPRYAGGGRSSIYASA